jgi:hypothetical protein
MRLLLHATNADEKAINWLTRNGWSIKNGWLDCTKWIASFKKDCIQDFCTMMREFTSVDLHFDEYMIKWE